MVANDGQFEVLLELRENQRDEARAALSDELAELERLRKFADQKRDEIREVEEEIAELEARRERMIDSGSFKPREVSALGRHAKTLQQRLEQRRAALDRALEAVEEQQARCDEARGVLRDAQTDLKAVRKHYERIEEERELERKRNAANANDEVAIRRWWEQNN